MHKAFSPKKLDLNVSKSCSNSGIKNGAVHVQRLWNDLPYEVKLKTISAQRSSSKCKN